MLKITRKKAIEMLVYKEIERVTVDELLDMYENSAINGSVGYNSFSDDELAEQVEFAYNEMGGVRIIADDN